MDIRARIKAVINENPEMTVRNVSLAAGLSDSALHKFLTGATNSLTLETVDKIAAALGVDPAWLAYGEGDPESASDITNLWDRISERDRQRARRILEEFTRTGTDD
jgi:transcriptional regulator with XRE-family HTH domain